MEIIKHRINLREDLASLSDEYGAEIDIRYHNNELVLHHDPFNHHDDKDLLTLEEFLSNWQNNKTLIFNIKSEGIENKCIELANKYNIKKWFFLDLSMPYFVKYINILRLEKNKGFNRDNLAVRFSDEEPIEYCKNFLDEVSWVWIDYFHLHPLNDITYKIFKDHMIFGTGVKGFRYLLSKYGNIMIRYVLNINLNEFTTSYRCFNLKKLKKFHFNQVVVSGYSFFMFVIYLLNKFNYSIKEIPIYFHERTHGKSKIPKIETFRTLLTLLLIKIGYFK